MQSNELHLSSVMENSSPWKVRSSGSYISKIAKMQNQQAAIILKQDSNKPLRFLYLYLFTNKKNAAFMQNILAKIAHIKAHKQVLAFLNLPHTFASLLPTTVEAIHQLLQQLHKKLENHSFTHTAILKLSHEFAIIDPLLISSLRIIVEDFQLSSTALDWNASLSLNQTEILLQRLASEKTVLSSRNKFVLFHNLSELEYQFFRARKIPVVGECFDELSDNQTLRYQEYLMIEKTFSLLCLPATVLFNPYETIRTDFTCNLTQTAASLSASHSPDSLAPPAPSQWPLPSTCQPADRWPTHSVSAGLEHFSTPRVLFAPSDCWRCLG